MNFTGNVSREGRRLIKEEYSEEKNLVLEEHLIFEIILGRQLKI